MAWVALLLCAGLGTRLRPLTTQLPKPLVPLGDRPLVDHAVSQLRAAGVRRFELNAFHLAEQVQAYATRAAAKGGEFVCTVEAELRGTAGGIRGMSHGRASAIVWNGDIYAPDLKVAELLSHADEATPLLVVSRPVEGSGTLGVCANGRVVRLRGQRFGDERAGADYVGVAVLPRSFTSTLPERGCLVADGLIPWLAQGKRVNTYEYDGHWSDGGTLEQYLKQNLEWLRRQPCSNVSDAARTGTPASYVGPSAQCGPQVTLRSTVVGDAANVSGVGELSGCVVWPGAVAHAPLRDAVVLSDGAVVRPSLPGRHLYVGPDTSRTSDRES